MNATAGLAAASTEPLQRKFDELKAELQRVRGELAPKSSADPEKKTG